MSQLVDPPTPVPDAKPRMFGPGVSTPAPENRARSASMPAPPTDPVTDEEAMDIMRRMWNEPWQTFEDWAEGLDRLERHQEATKDANYGTY
jgi:hypothetical protein